MRIFSTILVTAYILMLSSCQVDQSKSDDLINLDIHEGVKNEKAFYLSEIVKDVEFVRLETKPECLINNGKFVIGKEFIVYLNRNPSKIFLFSRYGSFVRQIGKQGRGPGEFDNPISIDLSPMEDRILVVSNGRPNKLIEYSIEGKFIRSKNLPFYTDGSALYLNSEEQIYLQNFFPKDSMHYPRVLVSDFREVGVNPIYFVDFHRNPEIMQVYALRSLLGRLDNGFNFRHSLSDTVYFVDQQLNLYPKYNLVIGPNQPQYSRMTVEEWDSFSNNVDMVNELKDFVLLTAKVDGKRCYLAYDKIHNEIFSIKRPLKCDGSPGHGIDDDLIGTGPFWEWDAADLRYNLLASQLDIIDLKELIISDCFIDRELKTDEYRKNLVAIVNASTENDNPVIRILHLR